MISLNAPPGAGNKVRTPERRPYGVLKNNSEKRKEKKMNNWFDSGYSVGHSESSATSKNKINSYSQAVKNRYLQLFDLDVTYSTASFQSSLDTCKGTVTSSNVLSDCTHPTQRHDFSLHKDGDNYNYSNHIVLFIYFEFMRDR